METTTIEFAMASLVILILLSLNLASVYMMYTNTSQDIIKKEIAINLMQIKVAEGELETDKLKADSRIKNSIIDALAIQEPNLMMLC